MKKLGIFLLCALISSLAMAQLPGKDKLQNLKKIGERKPEVKVPDTSTGGGNAAASNADLSRNNTTANPTKIMENKKKLTPFQNESAQSGFKDENGQIVIAAQFERAYPFKEGLARVRKGGLWGYIDEDGKTIIEF